MLPTLLDRLSAVADAPPHDELVRSLLGVLQALTGLESVYLSRVDEERRFHTMPYALNSAPERLRLAENAPVPWTATVCRRSLEEGVFLTQQADALWADLDLVRAHGLCTYLGEPVRDARGTLLGTLGGVSPRRVPIADGVQPVWRRFARLIAHQHAREEQVRFLSRHTRELSSRVSVLAQHATVDPLTELPNRRAFDGELARALAEAARTGGRVALVFIDLDRFKAINDVHGHQVGDRFLALMARRLAATKRRNEMIARFGGDEFVGVVRLPPGEVPTLEVERLLAERFAGATRGPCRLGETTLDYEGASVGVAFSASPDESAETLLHRADAAMYAVKGARARARDEWNVLRGVTLSLA